MGIKANKSFFNVIKHHKDSLILIHQNIRGLGSKNDELLCSIVSNNINPHLICLSEHHLSDQKLPFINMQNYVLGTSYARSIHHGGGVCIYIRSDLKFTAINLTQYCDEMNIEICAIKIMAGKTNIIVICIYRSPCGNFEYFVNKLDKVLKLLYKPKNEFIICGDFNVNFLEESGRKVQLALMLKSYNTFQTIQFPTRITETTSSVIDNIFIDNARINSFEVISISNGLSDHEAQCLVMKNSFNLENQTTHGITTRLVNEDTIAEFLYKLSNEKWESIYELNDVNEIFNFFLHTYLIVYESCFPKHNVSMKHKDNGWITVGIRTSCRRKENLYIISRNNNDYLFKSYYRCYCSILKRVIREAKRTYYNQLLSTTENKIKTIWKITDIETGKKKQY
jgi:exonuclease III